MKQITLNTSYHKSTSRGDKQEQRAFNLLDINKWIGHNFRTYNDRFNKSIKSKIDFELTKNNHYLKNDLSYKEWFNNQVDKKYIDEFNAKQTRKDRMIKDYDYFNYMIKREGNQSAIGEQLIFSFGSEADFRNLNELMKNDDDWINLWKEYQMNLRSELNNIMPDFKIYNMALHLDETTPHIHLIGVGFKEFKDAKNGLKFRLTSRHIFSRDSLKEHHIKLREFNIKYANKLNELIKEKDLVLKDNEFIKRPKGILKKYDEVEFISNLENIDINRKSLRVKDKELANVINRINTNLIGKKDLEVLQVITNEKLGNVKTKTELINENALNRLNHLENKLDKEIENGIKKKVKTEYDKELEKLKKEKEKFSDEKQEVYKNETKLENEIAILKSSIVGKDLEIRNLKISLNGKDIEILKLEKLNAINKIERVNIKDEVKDAWIDKVYKAKSKAEVDLVLTKFNNMLSNANKGHLEQDFEKDNDFIPKM